jgi:microcin C transport system permease protein
MIPSFIKNPMTQKRISRFKEMKRAYISFWILLVLYGLSLGSELVCNSVPLLVRFQGEFYFPVFRFYPEDTFTGNNKQTRADYHRINRSSPFVKNEENYMIFPPFPYGPYQSIDPELIKVSDHIRVSFEALPMIATVNIRNDFSMDRPYRMAFFAGKSDRELQGRLLTDYFSLPFDLEQAVHERFANRPAPPVSAEVSRIGGGRFSVSLSTYRKRSDPPQTVRLSFRELPPKGAFAGQGPYEVQFNRRRERVEEYKDSGAPDLWQKVSDTDKKEILKLVGSRYFGPVDHLLVEIDARNYTLGFYKEDVRFPFPPTPGHIMGIDGAGRDVLARILYGLRTSMTFGIILVAGSMFIGIATGALQGYYGGIIDISGQRLIEIWSALPFLYVMILMGSIYGRSFSLLLFCYGLFNWIGISYYIRAEFLRLRKQPFVEAAKVMGVPSYKIIFKHILPNGLIPVITFFPFSLVGAIGSLAALDYLGFGLPPPTPSWGELLYQAQQYRWAWWLILYPSLALFIVMLLGVFVGEGIRNAYDPKRYARLE